MFVLFGTANAQRIAIMGAMDEEIELLKVDLLHKKEVRKNGITFFTGKLKGQKVVLLKAGIGKTNAAYSTAILTANFKLKGLIFTGVAGGLHPDILPGDIVVATKMIQYDFGAFKNGAFETWPTRNLVQNNKRNTLYLPVDSYLLEKTKKVVEQIKLAPFQHRIPKIYTGVIATGDTFLSDSKKAEELYSNFKALAVEMEGAAVAQICTMLKLPYIVIRSCSDNANRNAPSDYAAFVKVAAGNSAQMVLALLDHYKGEK
ncbi:5'-methylthioadenosine/adenosylhomocysteine nucleosidase [Maribacter sp. 4G9]|uniref:5'-methylthioadenosine/adenosylhomocysteine nucleosidase n=1 Tax=Maribacter sp. 4G9 TaxID=1889777 RepID=UPI0013FDED94|nr:5'-methylthioadenosine/adenosylhomocysteine nucleosidase [Maribacter sp. 4G9]